MVYTRNDSPTGFQRTLINPEEFNYIDLIESKLIEALKDSRGIIRKICYHILRAGGKRVRPLLVCHSGMLFGEASEELFQAAVSVELIHMASLIHDDIIDETEFRRNQPTAQALWGVQHAVLGGDYLFAKAFRILADQKLVEPLEVMAHTVQTMCQGEIEQDSDQFQPLTDFDRYYSRITQKTASLIEASCRVGALVCQAPPDAVETIAQFGLHLGLAYQIIDDILDFCGDEIYMGKPKFTDLTKGNLTLPILLLLERSSEYEWLKEKLQERPFDQTLLPIIENAIRQSGVLKEAYRITVNHLDIARQNLRQCPNSPERRFLEELTDKLQARAN
ncbi:MAG TPA: polyprenyl synthetase family protein [Bacillota bacterium]|nr:polyprenyl synthetase family protein [Bacillota bacterium]HPT88108.1 polyprenyl synthetase family protein [Bacillota bacterium]